MTTLQRLRKAAFDKGIQPSRLLYEIVLEYLDRFEKDSIN